MFRSNRMPSFWTKGLTLVFRLSKKCQCMCIYVYVFSATLLQGSSISLPNGPTTQPAACSPSNAGLSMYKDAEHERASRGHTKPHIHAVTAFPRMSIWRTNAGVTSIMPAISYSKSNFMCQYWKKGSSCLGTCLNLARVALLWCTYVRVTRYSRASAWRSETIRAHRAQAWTSRIELKYVCKSYLPTCDREAHLKIYVNATLVRPLFNGYSACITQAYNSETRKTTRKTWCRCSTHIVDVIFWRAH